MSKAFMWVENGRAEAPPALLGEFLVQVGQRPQRLGRHRPLTGQHRQLTPARGDHLALHQQQVAQVDVGLERGQGVGPDAVQRHHHLQASAVTLLQGGEAELAADPDVHHPAGHGHDHAAALAGLQTGVRAADIGQGGGARHGHRIRVVTTGE
jgi:hypothetical protein